MATPEDVASKSVYVINMITFIIVWCLHVSLIPHILDLHVQGFRLSNKIFCFSKLLLQQRTV